MKRIEILALLSLSLSSCSEYFQMNLITNLKTKEYGNEQSAKY